MQNSNPELSIIVVNYRSEQYLKSCVASIFNNLKAKINLEIIIVNNDSQEFLKNIVDKFPEIKLISNKRNIGFGAANNKGAKEARSPYLLFLNPDTGILSDEASEILAKFAEDKELAVVGPRLVDVAGKTQLWCAGKELTIKQLIKNNLGITESKRIWESKKLIFTDWVSGAAMFVKKETFEKVGGFDENFFMYFEDADLCRRIRMAGGKVLYCPSVSVLHKGGQSRESLFKQKRQFFQSMAYFFWKKI